jgi:RHS repeat-associated protein
VSWLHSAVRCIVLFAAGAASLVAVAQAPPAADDGTGAYILVLQEGYSAPPGESKRKEPDVAKHGGHVVRAHGKERFIRLPRAAAQALCAEEGVLYLQRVWQGESLESEGEPPCGPKPQSAEIRANTGTGPHWETGDYTYDAAGNIRQIGNDLYAYDSAGRLISANVTGTVETYKYDSFGNLVEKSITGQPASPIAVDPSSNRLVGVTYDVAGNVTTDGTRTYTYDAVGMLDYAYDAGPPVRYIYTAADERIATFRNSSTYRMTLRDAQGKVVREYEADAFAGPAPWRWVQDYVYADGHAVAAEREAIYHGKRHLHADHLGSIRMVTDTTGDHLTEHKYYPFGVEQTSPVQETVEFGFDRPDPARFTGHERDYRWLNADHVDYLDYMHARYYKPAAGRFLSVDPVLDVERAIKNPQEWNRYGYVTNNPLKYTDPDGKDKFAAFFLGSAGNDIDTLDVIFDRQTIDEVKQGARTFFSEHEPMFRGFSPFPTTRTGAMMAVLLPGIGKYAGGVVAGVTDDVVGVGFKSFDSFKKAYGAAGQNQQWHHIVEQTAGNVAQFGQRAIHNTGNLIKVSTETHRKISGYYSSKQAFTGGLTVRQWLSKKSMKEQYEFGMQVLRTHGVVQ